VRKSPDPADGRRELAELTADGRRAQVTGSERRNRVLADLLDERLTAAERAMLAQTLVLLERVAFDEPA
jgi:DNA-binding MarR family transcriptional regulator